MPLKTLLVVAGSGQLALAGASLAIPGVLGWRRETAKLTPLTRQVFWLFAVYIWGFNVSFGLVSVLDPGWLVDGTPLASAVCGFIAVFWGARLAAQFVWFDREAIPEGVRYRLAEAALVALFLFLVVVYEWALLHDLRTP